MRNESKIVCTYHATPLDMPRRVPGRRRATALDSCSRGTRRPSSLRCGRTALLIDLENVLHEGKSRVTHEVGAERLDAIFAVAGHADHIFVAGQRWALERHLDVFADRHIPVAVASTEPDDADRLIGERFGFLAERHFGEFYLASQDGYFAKFAADRDTVVLSPNPWTVSSRLREVAIGIIPLRGRRPGDTGR